MAIAPLTITLEREMVVDFSKPFLSLDLNSNRSKKKMSTVFSFLKPLSKELWVSIKLIIILGSRLHFTNID